jgi:hypothetical protein
MGVAKSILHEGAVRPGIEQMHGNRMPQRMKSTLLFWNLCHTTIFVYQVSIGMTLQRNISIRNEKIGRIILTGA